MLPPAPSTPLRVSLLKSKGTPERPVAQLLVADFRHFRGSPQGLATAQGRAI